MSAIQKHPVRFMLLSVIIYALVAVVLGNLRHTGGEFFTRSNISHTKIDPAVAQLIKSLPNQALSMTSNYQKAYALFIHKKFMQAYQQFLPLGLKGSDRALLILGYLNEFGRGVAQNYQKAALWYYQGISDITMNNQNPYIRGIQAYNHHQYKDAAIWLRMALELTTDRL